MKVVLLRHGESLWNKQNKFTGWADPDLSEKGIREARSAGQNLREQGLNFDVAFVSTLKRAIRTLWLTLDELDQMWIPVHRSWRLNERHYGALQGLDKGETAEKYGAEQVHIWRRSYDVPPPALTIDDERYSGNDPKYQKLSAAQIPLTESLADTSDRFMPYWHGEIEPMIRDGKEVIIVAHGNTLRALVKYLDSMSEAEILKFNIPTGVPLIYELQ